MLMNAQQLKKLSIQVMIGSLIGSAALAVIAVLVGSFSDTFGKALFTLLFVMIHALACLGFADQAAKPNEKNLRFFENSVFTLIVLSFFTSIFGVWGIIDGEIITKLYGTYGVLFFASLHGQMLSQTTGKQSNIDNIVYANYALMAVVILLLLPVIWVDSSSFEGFYYRLLAAFGIIDATLTILAVILHRMYLQKHPETRSTIFLTTQLDANGNPVQVKAVEQKRRMHPLLWILVIYLGFQVVASLVVAVLGGLSR